MDLAGNISTASVAFRLEVGPIAPTDLTIDIESSANLSWKKPEPEVIAYRVYRDGVRISPSLHADAFFNDIGYAAGAHVYEVSAVDIRGVEGPKARAVIPAVSLGIAPVTPTLGFFTAVPLTVSNLSTTTLTAGPATLEIFDGASTLATSNAPSRNIAGAGSGVLEGVFAVPVGLPLAVSLKATMALPAGPGVSVNLKKTISLSAVNPPEPIVEVFPEALVPGTESRVRVRLHNRGTAAMDVITARLAGSILEGVDNVQARLKTLDGTLLGVGKIKQTTGASVLAQPGSQLFFVSIAPGQSVLLEPISLLVPNTASGALLVEVLVSTPSFNLPVAAIGGTRGFTGQTTASVVQSIPYTVTALPGKPVYDQGEQVQLSGQALDSNGFAVVHATVSLHVLQGGFDRHLSTLTELSGSYAISFNPLPNEAGVYTVSASHPDVITHAAQSSFTIIGFQFAFKDFTLSLAQNSSLAFTVGLSNTGQSALEGLLFSTANLSASGVTLTLDPASLPSTLAAGQTANLRLTAQALPTAGSGNLLLEAVEAHGFKRSLPILIQASPAQVIPVATPQLFQIGVLSGESRSQAITLENKGFATWTGVTLSSPTLSWVHIDGLTSLGDIPPGGNANFTLRFEPPLDVPTTAYAQNPLIEVRSANAVTVPINVAVVVTSSRKGGVSFSIINGDKPLGPGSQGVPVAGASAVLTSLDIPGLVFNGAADANGIAQFAELPTGKYAYTIGAPGFEPVSDTLVVELGLNKSVPIILVAKAVTYTWSVTPTTIVDQFDVTLNAEFKTDIPAPVVVIDPAFLSIHVESGVDAFGQFTVTNFGLVKAFDVNIRPQSPDGEVHFELPFTTIPELKPQQSVTVPFKVRHGHLTDEPHCHPGGVDAKYSYECAAGTIIDPFSNPVILQVCSPGAGVKLPGVIAGPKPPPSPGGGGAASSPVFSFGSGSINFSQGANIIKKECRCAPEREKELNQAVDFVCLQQHSCDDVNTVLCIFPAFKESICNDLRRRTLLFDQCIEAREQLRDECYPDETTPGGKTHKQRIDEEKRGREKCLAKQALCGCGT